MSKAYETIKSCINDFYNHQENTVAELAAGQKKFQHNIKDNFMEGFLTDEEMDELIQMNASAFFEKKAEAEQADESEKEGTMNEKVIDALIRMGAKRWTKGNMDRLYINADMLGYEWRRRTSGSISEAFLNGEEISNSEMGRVLAAKTYIDCNDGTLHCSYDGQYNALLESAEALLEKAERKE